jgi:thiosulfate dehydrogenase
MNGAASKQGKPPAADSEVMADLVSYLYWLATGAPTGDDKIAGRGYPKLKETSAGFDPKRGAGVYAQNCAVCHGANGKGQYARGRTVFPPLWGSNSLLKNPSNDAGRIRS